MNEKWVKELMVLVFLEKNLGICKLKCLHDGQTDRLTDQPMDRQPLPVMAAVAVRKKVVSSGQFSPCFHLQSLKSFF